MPLGVGSPNTGWALLQSTAPTHRIAAGLPATISGGRCEVFAQANAALSRSLLPLDQNNDASCTSPLGIRWYQNSVTPEDRTVRPGGRNPPHAGSGIIVGRSGGGEGGMGAFPREAVMTTVSEGAGGIQPDDDSASAGQAMSAFETKANRKTRPHALLRTAALARMLAEQLPYADPMSVTSPNRQKKAVWANMG